MDTENFAMERQRNDVTCGIIVGFVGMPHPSPHGLKNRMALLWCHLGLAAKQVMACGSKDSVKPVGLYTGGLREIFPGREHA